MSTHHPRKRFGQHFLTDQHIIDKIVAAIDPHPKQNLIEIGPGLGAITLPVLALCQQLTVIELDRDVIPILQEKCTDIGTLNVIQADVLKMNFDKFGANLRLIGNLPYNISTPLLFHLMKFHAQIQDMHFMLQKEVVDRLVAKPHSKDYGRLSVMMQFYCEMERCFNVPPGAFNPPPKVDSAVVRIIPKKHLPMVNADHLSDIVRLAFGQRRKTLSNALKPLLTKAQIEQCQINPQARAETLSVNDFIKLAQVY